MPKLSDSATFWRSCTLLLLSFILGNATAFVAFGMSRASKQDLAQAISQQASTNQQLADGINRLNTNMADLVGYLKGRRVIDAQAP